MEDGFLLKLNSTLGRSLLAALLLWAAFPPLNWWPLAVMSIAIYLSWIYPTACISLRDYFAIWVGASLSWLGLLQGIRLAFWPLYAGWIALSLYLAIYTVCFVALSRSLVHRWQWPIVFAAPMAWASLELVRGYIITGFSSCLLGHVVANHPFPMQIAAHLGAYGVSLWIVLLAVVLYFFLDHGDWLRKQSSTKGSIKSLPLYCLHIRQIVFASLLLVSAFAFSYWELQRSKKITDETPPMFTAALIQENSPTIFDTDETRVKNRNALSWGNYLEGTRIAAQSANELDLVVWPESMFTGNETVFDWDRSKTLPPSLVEAGIDLDYLTQIVDSYQQVLEAKLSRIFEVVGISKRPCLLLGNDVTYIRGEVDERFNAALWVNPEGKMVDYYAKQHRVMFGEYIPFADYFPIIYRIPGVPRLSAGQRAVSFDLAGKARIVPSICFENVLPHVLHRQIRALERNAESPDVMVNITNDGWFRGSSISDHHLANATFACVENRRPMLIAANTGLSAWIDGGGKRVAVSPRLKTDFIIARPNRDGRWGLWQVAGDWPMRLVAAVCFGMWFFPSKSAVIAYVYRALYNSKT